MILQHVSEYNKIYQSDCLCVQLNVLQTLPAGLFILNSIQNDQNLRTN